jgi:hypothetical protein
MSTTGSTLNRSWRFFAALEDIVQEVREWGRRTEKVALTFMALFRDEELCLCFGLDAFGDDAQTERVAEGDRCATHGTRFVVVADFFDE